MSKRRARFRPEAEAAQFIISGSDKPCLKAQWINDYKGRGVFACAPIEKGSFVVEYRGELISQYERDKRQKKYTEKENVFLFDFEWNNSSWCIDASQEDDSLGRLVNDGHKSPNCKMKKLTVQGKPHLCLFAIEDIQAESEITYDYGESQWPWRALAPSVQILAHPSADQELSERSTSSFQQAPSVQFLTHPSADQELSERSTSSFQQAPSVQFLAHPSADQELSERSTSSFQQAPSVQFLAHPSADQELSERSTSSFQQVSQTTGGVSSHQTATVKKLRASRHLQNLKRHHDRCEKRYDEAKKYISEKDRQMTLSLFTRMNNSVEQPLVNDGGFHDGTSASLSDQISTDESADCTDYEDIDYVPDSSGNSSGESVRSKELRIQESLAPKKVLKDMLVEIATTHSGEITGSESPTSFSSSLRSSSHSNSGMSCSASSSGNTSHSNSSIKVTPLPNSAKQSKYNKKQYCLYCKKAISKLARHLESAHSQQPDVARALGFDKRSRERRDMLRSIKKMGNFNHNATVATSGAGEMVACRRPTKARDSDCYRHCKFCQGLYARDCLWRHVRKCPQKSTEGEPSAGRKRMQLDLPKPDQFHEAVWKIACEMNQDDISLVVRSERDILSLGESLYNARKPHERRNDYIRQKMREMARLLITARAMTHLRSTEDLVMPSNFPQVIQAVRAVAGYELESNSYKTPSLALKLGHSLAKVAGIVQCNAIIANRHDVAESAKQFATLYEKKWNESISAAALGTLKQAKWNKPQLLPFTQDVSRLHKFLATESAKCMKDLEENRNSITFGNLAKVTLTQVVLFNRKRQGEVSKMELQVFTSRNRTELNPDIMIGLTELEKKLARHFDRVEIRGKGSRMVPVLLTPDMIAAMDLLVTNRNDCQVCTENVYLFARPGVFSHYRGSDCFRKYAKQCGAKYPEALTSTRLRKQVATLSTVLNLKENEMDQLATFLGHNIRVHREFYRLPESTLQLAKVSKLLIAMEKGKLSDLQGKGLDDIEINPDDEVTTSDDDSSEETIADLHQLKGSRTETSGDPSHALDSTTLDSMEGTSASTTLDNMEGNSASTTLDNMEGTSVSTTLDNKNGNTEPRNDSQQSTALQVGTSKASSKCSSGKQAGKVRSKWTGDEVKAVEQHMMHFITSCKVPGKRDCESCLQAELVALKDRDWVAIKYYIHNRIIALKRKMNR
ncbi:uncharacterized protein LOC119023775 isoform X3 [Acanthopagrus latus]|uniref:uncharacterized protein LOC119023775 isoform X3 n=1 Tax=Acanthopagrus latus TaxID=8177 RepID=UPI00187BF6FE|nr:uncharacterized protein LOC119023775 isoform X3 [Acanthopagrus latus]